MKGAYKAQIKEGLLDCSHICAGTANDLPLKHALEDLGDGSFLLQDES
jgi:hypothetical protein